MPETTQTIKVPTGLQVRAAVMPETFNRESRTVELQFGSDTPTPMPYYDARMMESLSFAAGHCRLGRRPYSEYADISTACSSYRLMINCK